MRAAERSVPVFTLFIVFISLTFRGPGSVSVKQQCLWGEWAKANVAGPELYFSEQPRPA